MKKIMGSLIVVFLSISTFCQTTATLSETLDWIKTKIEAYPSCGQIICYTASVQYDLGYKDITIAYTSNLNNKVTYRIPLKDINTSGYSYTKDYLFRIATKSPSITWIEAGADGSRETKKVSEVFLVFDGPKFRANDLESRLIKAFNNAVILSGGTVAKEVF